MVMDIEADGGRMKPKIITLQHPENEIVVDATFRNWMENGRFVGYILRFPGEHHERHLYFSEVAALQQAAAEKETQYETTTI